MTFDWMLSFREIVSYESRPIPTKNVNAEVADSGQIWSCV